MHGNQKARTHQKQGKCLAWIGGLQLLTQSTQNQLLLHITWPNALCFKGRQIACQKQGKKSIKAWLKSQEWWLDFHWLLCLLWQIVLACHWFVASVDKSNASKPLASFISWLPKDIGRIMGRGAQQSWLKSARKKVKYIMLIVVFFPLVG